MTIFQFKHGSRVCGNAQAVGERLTELEAHGRLTPERVVADAKDDASVLHPFFEWDDTKAATLHRLTQAGHLIRCVTVVVEEGQKSEAPTVIRAFVPIQAHTEGEDDDGRSYVPTLRALSDLEMRKQVLAQAHAELGAVARKYRELKELSQVVEAIDRVGKLLQEGQQA